MKILIVILAILSIILLIGLFLMSAKLLKNAHKQQNTLNPDQKSKPDSNK